MVATRRTRSRPVEASLSDDEPSSAATITNSPRKTRSGRARLNQQEGASSSPALVRLSFSSDSIENFIPRRRGRPRKSMRPREENVVENSCASLSSTLPSTPLRLPLADVTHSECRLDHIVLDPLIGDSYNIAQTLNHVSTPQKSPGKIAVYESPRENSVEGSESQLTPRTRPDVACETAKAFSYGTSLDIEADVEDITLATSVRAVDSSSAYDPGTMNSIHKEKNVAVSFSCDNSRHRFSSPVMIAISPFGDLTAAHPARNRSSLMPQPRDPVLDQHVSDYPLKILHDSPRDDNANSSYEVAVQRCILPSADVSPVTNLDDRRDSEECLLSESYQPPPGNKDSPIKSADCVPGRPDAFSQEYHILVRSNDLRLTPRRLSPPTMKMTTPLTTWIDGIEVPLPPDEWSPIKILPVGPTKEVMNSILYEAVGEPVDSLEGISDAHQIQPMTKKTEQQSVEQSSQSSFESASEALSAEKSLQINIASVSASSLIPNGDMLSQSPEILISDDSASTQRDMIHTTDDTIAVTEPKSPTGEHDGPQNYVIFPEVATPAKRTLCEAVPILEDNSLVEAIESEILAPETIVVAESLPDSNASDFLEERSELSFATKFDPQEVMQSNVEEESHAEPNSPQTTPHLDLEWSTRFSAAAYNSLEANTTYASVTDSVSDQERNFVSDEQGKEGLSPSWTPVRVEQLCYIDELDTGSCRTLNTDQEQLPPVAEHEIDDRRTDEQCPVEKNFQAPQVLDSNRAAESGIIRKELSLSAKQFLGGSSMDSNMDLSFIEQERLDAGIRSPLNKDLTEDCRRSPESIDDEFSPVRVHCDLPDEKLQLDEASPQIRPTTIVFVEQPDALTLSAKDLGEHLSCQASSAPPVSQVSVTESLIQRTKKSPPRRQSRRQSYMTATKSAARERELELQNRQEQQDEADLQLVAEVDIRDYLLQEMPGSVERKRTKRRSNSASRKSPLVKQRRVITETFSPVTLPAVNTALVYDPHALVRTSAIRIQALFRGYRARRCIKERFSADNNQVAVTETYQETQHQESNMADANLAEVVNSGNHDINDVFSDFLSKWQSKKSLKAKIGEDTSHAWPARGGPPATPKRVLVGTLSPHKRSEKKPILVVTTLPSSAQKSTSRPGLASRASTSSLAAPRPTSLTRTISAPDPLKGSSKIVATKRGIPVPNKILPSLIPSPAKSLGSSGAENTRKRKDLQSATILSNRKRSKPQPTPLPAAFQANSINPSATLPIARNKALGIPNSSRPGTLVPPKSLLHLTPAEVTKATRQFTSQNRLYRCDFDREIVKKEIPRPPSPTAKIQAKMACNARTKRRRLMKEKGYTFGAGDPEDYVPLQVTPERKAVKWGEDLEVDLQTLPKNSPSRVKGLGEVIPCIMPASLDEYGNAEDTTPLTPMLGKAQTITIKKYLYRGEKDE